MKKATMAATACVLAIGSILAACSGTSEEGTDSLGGSSQDAITLNFWGAIPENAGPAQVVENWNKANPDIQVNYKRYVNDEAGNTKLQVALMAAGEVDLYISYRMDHNMQRIAANMAEPLDDYIERDQFDVAGEFGDNAIVSPDGKTYYIPAIILNDFVQLNKSMLDAANLPVPKEWTWEEYMNYAEALSSGQGTNKVWGSYVGGITPKVYEWLEKAVKVAIGPNAFYKEEGTSNFDHPAFKQFLEVQVNLQNQLKVQPNFAEAFATKMDGNQLFLSGKTAMLWQGTAGLRYIKNTEDYPHDFVTAFAPVPKLNEGDAYSTAGTGYLDFVSISSNSKYKEAAWKFLKWYVTEGNEPMISGGRVPAWKKADPDRVISLILGERPEELFDVESFRHALMLDQEFIVDTKFDKMPQLQKIVEDQGQRVYIGEQTIEQALDNMKTEADAVLTSN